MSTDNSTLAISVVIPCRNEQGFIEACVRSILNQEPPPGGFEVIVADGMSDDNTRKILRRLEKQDARLRLVDNPQRITPAGMNVGILNARGRHVAIMGAHNRYAVDYLVRSIEVLERTGADNVGGAMVSEGTTLVQRAIAAAHHSPFSVGNARWHNPSYEGWADTVFGGVYRREVFDRIGLFDEELVRNQDDELNLRLTRAGGKIFQSPQIKSWYNPRGSLGELFIQYLQYGYWKVRVIQKHKVPASIRHIVPGIFVLTLMALPLLSLLGISYASWTSAGIAGTYLACTWIASTLTAARYHWRLLPLLPFAFACYHFAYGIGFLRGVLDFLILRRRPAATYVKLSREVLPNT